MSDDSGFQDRTEAPTPKRRRDARGKGQVPKSQEVTTAFLLLAAAMVFSNGGAAMARAMGLLFTETALGAVGTLGGFEGTVGWLQQVGWVVLGALTPVLLTMAGVALVIGGIQAQGVLTLEPLKPKFERLSPQKNIKRIWGIQAPVQLTKSILKLGIITGAMVLSVRP